MRSAPGFLITARWAWKKQQKKFAVRSLKFGVRSGRNGMALPFLLRLQSSVFLDIVGTCFRKRRGSMPPGDSLADLPAGMQVADFCNSLAQGTRDRV
jgi:hypothetical protein